MCSSQGTAIATVTIENERVRVTEWRFRNKGDNTGWHRHDYDYIVVPQFDGVLDIKDATGTITQAKLQSGVSYFRKLGVEHDVINGNDFECAFVEIELLEQPGA